MNGRTQNGWIGALGLVLLLGACGESGDTSQSADSAGQDASSLATNQQTPDASEGVSGAQGTTIRAAGYEIVIRTADDAQTTRIEIVRDGNTYWTRAARGLAPRRTLVDGGGTVAPGSDITGDGIADLVLREEGPDGPRFIVLSLGQEVDVVAELEASPEGRAGFRDYDGDGVLEFVTLDPTFKDILGAQSPTVILRYERGGYRLSTEDMARPEPTMEQMEPVIEQILLSEEWDAGRVPSELWERAADLVYSGYQDLAERFIRWCWPDGRDGLDAFLTTFRQAVAQSPYGRELIGESVGSGATDAPGQDAGNETGSPPRDDVQDDAGDSSGG